MASDSWFENFYTYFLARDIAYTFSGGLFIIILEYSLKGEIFFIPHELSLEMLGFLFISYILGMGLFFLTYSIPKFKIYKPLKQCPEPYSNIHVFNQDLLKYYNIRIINLKERDEYKKVLGISTGSTLFFGGLLIILIQIIKYIHYLEKIANDTSIIIFVLAIFGIILGWCIIKGVEGLEKSIQKDNRELAEDIKTIKSKTIEY